MNKINPFKFEDWKRAFHRMYTILLTYFREKEYSCKNGRIKYMLIKPKAHSDFLIVSFPACSDRPKYNYVGSLKRYNCNKLFILDDFAENHMGNYLVGGVRMKKSCN